MQFLDEDAFNAAFQQRLKATRTELGWKHGRMAHALGITEDAYKKIENRPRSAFPLYLLPVLVFATDRPLSYWLTSNVARPTKIRIVK